MRTHSLPSVLLIFVCAAGCTDAPVEIPQAPPSQIGGDAGVVQSASAAASAPEAGTPVALDAGSYATAQGLDGGPSPEITPFSLKPLAPGYMRFEASPVDVPGGSSEDWAQWVGGPLDQDYDVLDINGQQSAGGHHAILYATSDAHPPGFTRVWLDADQLTARLMGGIGGEGGANARLPPGVVFRVQKGSYLVMQTHFLNVSGRALVGRSVLDVKLAPVDHARRVASIFSNATLTVKLPPSAQTVIDVNCRVQEDLRFLQIVNHMHDNGRSVFTEFTDPSGQRHELKSDPAWSGEWALNPNFSRFTVEAPKVVPKGSMLHTRCTQLNQSAKEVTFPAEMCVFFGFILSESDMYCTDGTWTVASHPGEDDSTSSGSGDAGIDAGDAATGADASGPGGCRSSSDQAIMKASTFDKKSTDCSLPCAFNSDVASCTARCFQKDVGLSASCARCNGTNVACGAKKCLAECAADSASAACRSCVLTNCDPAFRVCTGT